MSSEIAIRVENLSKRYRIGTRANKAENLREAIVQASTAPFRRLGQKRAATLSRENRNDATLWAVKDISFQAKRGEVLGLIGSNGAGKSTLLKLLSRITTPTAGTVRMEGRVASLLEVGTGFHPELTGRENLYLNGAILGMTNREINRRFDEIVEFAGVEKFIDTPVKRYSSGMHMRLGFSVAAHLRPEILLIDEVLAVGDVEFQKKCIGKMESVAHEGRTVIVVSHSVATVRSLCSQAILLSQGEIAASGDVAHVIEAYLGVRPIDEATRDLVPHDFDVLGDRICLRRVCLAAATSNSFSIPWKHPISLTLELEVAESVGQVSFGAGVKALDGTWLFCTHHDGADHDRRWDLDAGRYQVNLTLDNPLKPGRYALSIGAHERHYANTLFHTEAITFEVLGHAADGSVPMIYDSGIFNGSGTWASPQRLI